MMRLKFNQQEKRTFLLLFIASIFNGFVLSAFKMQDIVAKKALGALDWQITILVMLWPLSNLVSLWWGKLLAHSGSLRKYFLLTGFVGRLSLIGMLWVDNFYSFLAIMVILFSFNALISPAQNSIYQNNFRSHNRGTAFGLISSVGTLVVIIVSFFAGKLLDIDGDYFRIMFAIIAVAGLIYSLIMSLIKVDKQKAEYETKNHLKEIFIKPLSQGFMLLKRNREFRLFQRNFFLYGIGFIIVTPAIPLYLVDTVGMSYSQIFLAKSILAELGVLLFAPLAGKFSDRINPAYFSFIAFGSLAIYPLILILSSFFLGTVWAVVIINIAFVIFGLAMSMIMISWNISSIHFAGDQDVSMYQSVHVTLTGLRGLFIPPLGLLVIKLFSIRAVFGIASIMLILASFLSLRLYFMMDKNLKDRNKRFAN